MLDKRRTSPDPESGQAILDPDFFTLSRTLDLASGKSVDCSILRPESQDLPGPASAARALWKKRGTKNMILETQECSSDNLSSRRENNSSNNV